MSDLNVTRTDLGEVPYAFLDAIVYDKTVYAVQKYISGAECRLVVFDRNSTYGMLSFDRKKYTVKSACATLTDAALAIWGERLFVFWKHTGSSWQVNYRSYSNTRDGKPLKELAEHDAFKVTPDCHCYNYIDAVVFKKSLYLLMAVNRDKKDRIELRRCSTPPTDGGELTFEEAVTFVSNNSTEVTDIKNSDTDTWDAQVWVNPDKGKNGLPAELLIVGRIHDEVMTAYIWDGKNWGSIATVSMTGMKKCASLKLIQAGALYENDSATDGMYFIYSDGTDKIKMRRYIPAARCFDRLDESTETEYGWMGVTSICNKKKTTGESQDEIHIISGRECHHNYDTMVKSVWAKR